MEKHLHIIALNVPYPADYGGVFDLFYKLPALQKQGIKIHLHCFEYGRGEQPELNKYCENVYYYKRRKGLSGLSFTLPHIVSSRKNKELTKRLLQDNYPILIEGIHCSYLLNDKRFTNRKCLVRLHNIEFKYYHHLYKSSASLFKKLYYKLESSLLFSYEKKIANKAIFLAVNKADEVFYKNEFNCKDIITLPLFLEERNVQSPTGKGLYSIYHADLSVPENEKIALWLINEVFIHLNQSLIITGKNPTQKIKESLAAKENIQLIANPDKALMDKLIQEAHIIFSPSLNATGIKVKLIESLFNGRFIITNNAAVAGTNFEALCTIAETTTEVHQSITTLNNKEFTLEEINKRKEILLREFDNAKNAETLIRIIFNY